jgi:hypothetical protein
MSGKRARSLLSAYLIAVFLHCQSASANELFQPGAYLKLSALLSDKSLPVQGLGRHTLVVNAIPLHDGRDYPRQQFNLHAKESRFWVRSLLPENFGSLRLLLEYDLLDSADDYSLRLRHFYAIRDIGGGHSLLLGQAYSTFASVAALADTEAGVALGNIVVRQPMIRWSWSSPADELRWVFALEESLSRIADTASSGLQIHAKDVVPDLVLKRETWRVWGSFSVAAMARQIRHEAFGQHSQSQWGGAVSFAGVVNVGRLDNIRVMLSGGNAAGRYIGNAVPDAYVNPAGNLQLQGAYAATFAYQHFWNESLRSTVSLGFSRARLPASVPAALTREARTANINLLWSPTEHYTLAAEYLSGYRSVKNGLQGELNRVQLSLRRNFQ